MVLVSIWNGPSASLGGCGTVLTIVSKSGDRSVGGVSMSIVATPSLAEA
jgi:hypothetical protein